MARRAPAITAAQRDIFFTHLAQTCNVSESARLAGVLSIEIYRERKISRSFCNEWARALAEGYVRLETDAVADALKPIGYAVTEKSLKLIAQRQRERQFLLSAHRASVRGEMKGPIAASTPGGKLPTAKQVTKELTDRLDAMRERMANDDDDKLSAA